MWNFAFQPLVESSTVDVVQHLSFGCLGVQERLEVCQVVRASESIWSRGHTMFKGTEAEDTMAYFGSST